MSEIETFAIVLSFVLGLGVTQILSAVVFVLQSRRQVSLSWPPFLWAFALLLYHINYLFALLWIFATAGRMVWYLDIAMVILLFLSGGLILPSESRDVPASLDQFFIEDGYLALVPLFLFLVLHLVYASLVGLGVWNFNGAMNFALLLTIAVGFAARRRASLLTSALFAAIATISFLFVWARPGAT